MLRSREGTPRLMLATRGNSERVIVAFCVPRALGITPGALRVIMFYAKESASLPRRRRRRHRHREKAATWQRSAAASKHRRGGESLAGCSRVTIYQSYNVSIAPRIAQMLRPL